MNTKYNYPILSPNQQYQNLISKGLKMDIEESLVDEFFKHNSYFKFMQYFKPYWSKVDNSRIFNSNSKLSKIFDDYNFDHELRVLLFGYIETIENSFKNIFCQQSCQVLGIDWRSNVRNLSDQSVYFDILQPHVDEVNNGKSRSQYIQMYINGGYLEKYPPFRNMLEVLTLGQIVKIFKYISDNNIKKQVSKNYNLDEKKFPSYVKTIVDVRNICCHHNKLLGKIDWKIADVKTHRNVLDGHKDDLYHICFVLQYLLFQIDGKLNFQKDLEKIIIKYPNVEINFPKNWIELWNNFFI